MLTAYLDPNCPLSQSLKAALDRLGLHYKLVEVSSSAASQEAKKRLFGEARLPCVEINGLRFPETTPAEIEHYLLTEGLISHGSVTSEPPSSLNASELLHRRLARANTQRFF